MNNVWILQVDNSPDLQAFGNEKLAEEKYAEHIDSRLPKIDNTEEDYLVEQYDVHGHKAYYYDGNFIASLTELEIHND